MHGPVDAAESKPVVALSPPLPDRVAAAGAPPPVRSPAVPAVAPGPSAQALRPVVQHSAEPTEANASAVAAAPPSGSDEMGAAASAPAAPGAPAAAGPAIGTPGRPLSEILALHLLLRQAAGFAGLPARAVVDWLERCGSRLQEELGEELAVEFYDAEGWFRRDLGAAVGGKDADSCRILLKIIGLIPQ